MKERGKDDLSFPKVLRTNFWELIFRPKFLGLVFKNGIRKIMVFSYKFYCVLYKMQDFMSFETVIKLCLGNDSQCQHLYST